MANKGLFIAGGAMAGIGQGLVEEGKQRRQMMLEQLRHSNDLARDEARDSRAAAREEARDLRLMERDEAREEARAKREGGLLTSVQQDENGNLIGITRSGQAVELGIKGKVKPEELEEIGDENSPTGTRLVPRSQAAGQPGKGTKDMRESIAAQREAERADARRQAEAEASDKAGWFSTDASDFKDDGGSRSAFIERRTNEILRARRGSGGEQKPTDAPKPQGAPKAEAPSGTGSRNDPFRATTQAHIEWFKTSAPAGTVIEVDGKLYTKK